MPRWQIGAASTVLGLFVGLVAVYCLLLLGTVSNITEYSELEEKTPSLSSEVSEMEFQYLAIKNELNKDLVGETGLVIAQDPEYIRTQALGHYDPLHTQ